MDIWAFFSGLQRLRSEADHLASSSVEVKNEETYRLLATYLVAEQETALFRFLL
jgi:hypothetical protein